MRRLVRCARYVRPRPRALCRVTGLLTAGTFSRPSWHPGEESTTDSPFGTVKVGWGDNRQAGPPLLSSLHCTPPTHCRRACALAACSFVDCCHSLVSILLGKVLASQQFSEVFEVAWRPEVEGVYRSVSQSVCQSVKRQPTHPIPGRAIHVCCMYVTSPVRLSVLCCLHCTAVPPRSQI